MSSRRIGSGGGLYDDQAVKQVFNLIKQVYTKSSLQSHQAQASKFAILTKCLLDDHTDFNVVRRKAQGKLKGFAMALKHGKDEFQGVA